MNIPLDEVIFFDCITSNPTTGAVADADSTPTFAVYEEATDTDIGIGGNLTKRTSLTGNYRGTFTLSAANGFEVGKWYSIIGSATVNSIAGKAVIKNFRVVAAEVTVGKDPVTVAAGDIATDAITAAALKADAVAEIADGVWDEAIAGHLSAGTTGLALNSAGSAGDPWATAVPGAYSAGTAGFILGTNLNATVSSRMATYTQPAGFLAATFPSDPADQSLIIAATNTILADTNAIKVKTDSLTFTTPLSVDATASIAAASIRSAIGMSTNDLDAQLDAILAASGASGAGSVTYNVTVTDNSANPLDGAEVWVSTDSIGTNVVAGTLNADALGVVTFYLDPGSYYLWVKHSGFNGTNPTAITVT